MDRRKAVAGGIAALAFPAWGKLARADRDVKASPIRWPADDGTILHGFMAIPAQAKGKQPAVLVIAGPASGTEFPITLTLSLAQAGLIGCAPEPALMSAAAGGSERAIGDLAATIGWLAHHAYATGRVGLLATKECESLLVRLATRRGVAASILLGSDVPPTIDGAAAVLALPAGETAAWPATWGRAVTHFREHLQ